MSTQDVSSSSVREPSEAENIYGESSIRRYEEFRAALIAKVGLTEVRWKVVESPFG
jgi:hypothetical protein